MKIAINGLHMKPSNTGGGETYFIELIRGLSQLDNSKYNFEILAHPEMATLLQQMSASHINFEYTTDTKNKRRFQRVMYLLNKLTSIGSIYPSKYDLIHWTNGQLRPRFASNKPVKILTFLDAQHLEFPEFFSKKELQTRARVWKSSIDEADHIITISNFAKHQAIEHYQAPAEKISAIPLGVRREFFSTDADDIAVSEIKTRYHLPERYLYYPAGTWSHKNHERLLNALKILVNRGLIDIKLVLSGVHKNQHEVVLQKINTLQLDNHVQHIGFAQWEDVPKLYQLSEGLIFPSLFEGFGLPVLEAMAAGIPVAASNLDIIREVADDTILYFNPYIIDDIADAMLKLWGNKVTDTSVSKSRAEQFSWEANVKQTLNVYEMFT